LGRTRSLGEHAAWANTQLGRTRSLGEHAAWANTQVRPYFEYDRLGGAYLPVCPILWANTLLRPYSI
ncbi:MAG: hypothetical protein DRR00_22335, partial [Candidatus Parabeggiatoa sp. nov. 3]